MLRRTRSPEERNAEMRSSAEAMEEFLQQSAHAARVRRSTTATTILFFLFFIISIIWRC